MAVLLELSQVVKFYGSHLVLGKTDCRFEAASVSLVTGANGAGKSTLLRLLAGLIRPSHGQVLRHRLPGTEALPRIAYLAHATFLYPGLTALENLDFWCRVQQTPARRAEIARALERVGLGRRANERAGVFSRGMAQRLNLARVLLAQADILLLDEPGTGLDAAARALLAEEIRAARQRGACVVLISHDTSGDAPLADRQLALEAGRLSLKAEFACSA